MLKLKTMYIPRASCQKRKIASCACSQEIRKHAAFDGNMDGWHWHRIGDAPGMPGTISLPPRVSDLDMHMARASRTCLDACRNRKLAVSYYVSGKKAMDAVDLTFITFQFISKIPVQPIGYLIIFDLRLQIDPKINNKSIFHWCIL